ncbi:MAG: cytochrome c5 family protein [Pseudomonadales bacterium]|nr:cytochrome c5 family protein [Pseudomonadales bacterium]NIX08936.1 cytochrome c5 family protein [Pseudomonadales bacterium]
MLVCFALGCAESPEKAPAATAAGEEGPAAAAHPGEQTYKRFCFSCHAAGIAGAPRTGDARAWAPRLAKGADQLLRTTIEGIPPGMPAMGLCRQCSEDDLRAAIDYMIPDA